MQHRYDFVYLFEVRDGNPNGDPDAGNLPRVDPENGHGLVTDVCLKRKVRNFVGLVKGEQPPFEIYVKEKAVLNRQHERAYTALNVPRSTAAEKPAEDDAEGDKAKGKKPKRPAKSADDARNLTRWMCDNFYDIRAFGAVMTTEVNCGQVRGPIQFAFARSIDPIVTLEHAVTRCAVTNEKDLEKERTMGRKFTVPYGLYRVHGFINPHLAEQTGFNSNGEDFALFCKALELMFESDRSAARGEMAARRLILFKHDSKLGNAPAHQLFALVNVAGRSKDAPPRRFEDYDVQVDAANLPKGVTIEQPF